MAKEMTAFPTRIQGPDDMVAIIKAAVAHHHHWLNLWHRMAVCRLAPASELLVPSLDPKDFLKKLEQEKPLNGGDKKTGLPPHPDQFSQWYLLHGDHPLLQQGSFRSLWSAHRDFRDLGTLLAARLAEGRVLPVVEYDVLIDKSQHFLALAEKLRQAFTKATAELDPLTGISNRVVMQHELANEYERARRTKLPCCIALVDLDHFKAVNDQYGHASGDKVLSETASRLLGQLRAYDMIYRYGGEEFLICLPNCDGPTAKTILERLRQEIASRPIALPGKGDLQVTASFGFAMMAIDLPLKATIERADMALYAAKEAGRNRSLAWDAAMLGRTPDMAEKTADRAR